MWIARDINGSLYIYTDKPKKHPEEGYWSLSKGDCCDIPSEFWPEVSWEDKEPRELILKPVNSEKI